MRKKITLSDELVAKALRFLAAKMCDAPELYTSENGQMVDRALRSCPAISDIDVVWVRWRYVGEKQKWITRD